MYKYAGKWEKIRLQQNYEQQKNELRWNPLTNATSYENIKFILESQINQTQTKQNCGIIQMGYRSMNKTKLRLCNNLNQGCN